MSNILPKSSEARKKPPAHRVDRTQGRVNIIPNTWAPHRFVRPNVSGQGIVSPDNTLIKPLNHMTRLNKPFKAWVSYNSKQP